MQFDELVQLVADCLQRIDSDRPRHKGFPSGIGPFGEPQLLKRLATALSAHPNCQGACTRRTPDVLIQGRWALEFKLVRPFGDNGRQAEDWSVNVLHPYPGNTSLRGDAQKLAQLTGPERRAVIAIGFTHRPPQIPLGPLWRGFELLATELVGVPLSARVVAERGPLVHPVHQTRTVAGWEVLPAAHF